MGRGSKRNEQLKKKFGIGEHADDPPSQLTSNLNFKFDHTETMYGVKVIRRNSQNQSKHETEKQIDVSLMPHRLKNHGPAEHKFDKIKYSASVSPYEKSGNAKAKISICDRILNEKSALFSDEQKISEFAKKIPRLILDENIEKEKLAIHLNENGYDVIFLGRGVPDQLICKHAVQKNAIVVTADVDFALPLYRNEQKYEPIYIDQKTESLPENVRVISQKMEMFCLQLFGDEPSDENNP